VKSKINLEQISLNGEG